MHKQNAASIRAAGGLEQLVGALKRGVAEAVGGIMNLALRSPETHEQAMHGLHAAIESGPIGRYAKLMAAEARLHLPAPVTPTSR